MMTVWISSVQEFTSRTLARTNGAHNMVYSSLVVGGVLGLGECKEWLIFIADELATALISYSPVRLSISSTSDVADDILTGALTCNASGIASDLIGHLVTTFASPVTVTANTSIMCNGHIWTVGRCVGSSGPFICVDCRNYCSESLKGTPPDHAVSCVRESRGSTNAMRMIIIELDDISVPPVIQTLVTNTTGPTTLGLHFTLDRAEGSIVCGAFHPHENVPETMSDLLLRGPVQLIEDVNGTYALTGLTPSTLYHVYCGTFSSLGAPSKARDIQNTKQVAKSACCRYVSVDLLISAYSSSQDVAKAVRVSLHGSLPSDDLAVNVYVANSSNSIFREIFTPSVVRFSSASISMVTSLAYRQTQPGGYTVIAELSGGAASDYEVAFGTSRTVTVLSSTQEPPPPVLSSAYFTDDGTAVVITFNSPTDRGKFVNSFDCPLIFSATMATHSLCHWISDTTVTMVVTRTNAVIGDIIILKNHTVKAKCITSSVACVTWAFSSARAVAIAAPVKPIVPNIVIVSPSRIGPCDGLPVDFTASTGAGGRPFKSVTLQVSSVAPEIAPLQTFLNTMSSIQMPFTIENSLLRSGYAYNIVITICNFLAACTTATHHFVVSASANIPVVSVSSKRLIEIQRSTSLRIDGNAYVSTCDGRKSRADLDLTWSITRYGLPLALPSASNDPMVFRLPPHSLHVNELYTVTLSAKHRQSLKHSSTSVKVSVKQGKIIGNLAGSSSRGLRIGDVMTIDASKSYDEDVLDDSSHLDFSLACYQMLPEVLDTCLLGLVNVSHGVFQMYVPTQGAELFLNTTHEVSVIVSSGQRSTQVSVTVFILPSPAPSITLHAEGGNRMNPSQKLKIIGQVSLASTAVASWEVDDPSVSLSTIALCDITKPLIIAPSTAMTGVISTFQISLVLPAFSLPAQSSYTFTLRVATEMSGLSASAGLVISTNSPPYPGKYSISPQIGVQLDTEFLCQAVQWEDTDLPLTYEFAYQNPATEEFVVHRARMQLTFVKSYLPAGLEQMDFALNTQLQVFDSLDAKRAEQRPVVVKYIKKLSLEDIDTYFTGAVANSSGYTGEIMQYSVHVMCCLPFIWMSSAIIIGIFVLKILLSLQMN